MKGGREATMRIKAGVAAWVGLTMAMTVGVAAWASDPFTVPTKEELSMTSLPGYPGVSAVVLNYEELSKDDLHVIQRYKRIKILTEEGKQFANVELSFVRTGDSGFFSGSEGNEKTVGEIVGRTVHPDGTVIPFTGKPYLKVLEKVQGVKVQAQVFTLPDVEVGSIIEFRYATRYNDRVYESPDWYIQGDLYVKSAHYVWFPTTKDLVDSQQRAINAISWFPILPPEAKIVRTELPTGDAFHAKQTAYELTVHDVPPTVKEEYMPPLSSYSYRVYFNFTSYRSGADYWKSEGKDWSKRRDAFMKESGDIKAATAAAIGGETTPEGKLRKLYAKVESMENTEFTRARDSQEDGQVNNVSDVLKRERGTPTQLTELFVAMARSAGFKSYLMLVPNRAENFFTPMWLSFQQFDDVVAIVNVDGKEVFLDPGWRWTPYGRLAWQHTFVDGMRQVDGGTEMAKTSGDGYTANRTARVANLTMDEHGEITGKVDITYTGSPAVAWRHRALGGDNESLKEGLRKSMEETLPNSLEVKVSTIKNLEEYEQPLSVSFEVKGTLGTPTGKRLVLPVDLFETRSSAKFSQEKRETAVDFNYAAFTQDALRINFPKGFELEATPKDDKYSMPKAAAYDLSVTSGPKYFVVRRNFAMADFLFPANEYPALRSFYAQRETKDKESVVLKMVPVGVGSTPGN
jgi:hypothetical protein